MRKAFEIGGLVAGLVLVVFGIVVIVMGVNGRSTVTTSLKQQQIVGTAGYDAGRDHGRGAEGGVEERQHSDL